MPRVVEPREPFEVRQSYSAVVRINCEEAENRHERSLVVRGIGVMKR